MLARKWPRTLQQELFAAQAGLQSLAGIQSLLEINSSADEAKSVPLRPICAWSVTQTARNCHDTISNMTVTEL